MKTKKKWNNHPQYMKLDWILVQKMKERKKEGKKGSREGGRRKKKEEKRKEKETMKYDLGTIREI